MLHFVPNNRKSHLTLLPFSQFLWHKHNQKGDVPASNPWEHTFLLRQFYPLTNMLLLTQHSKSFVFFCIIRHRSPYTAVFELLQWLILANYHLHYRLLNPLSSYPLLRYP